MAADPVTPVAGLVTTLTTGGQSEIVVPPGPNGGFIVNPYTGTDQGLADPENLYVSPVDDATLEGNGVTFCLYPGQTWQLIPGQQTPTKVNAASSGHKFSAIYY